MRRCLELARLGAGNVSPNPMVGAVIVLNDRIIGEGYHRQYGGPHAEVQAIRAVTERFPNAAELLEKATIYVNLEPCAHFGKTPPCADLVVRHRIPRVVLGAYDPFPDVNGKGIEKLRSAGIEVITGMCEPEAGDLNKRFFTAIQQQRPYIILKWAQTGNRLFAPADRSQRWISSPAAKTLVHRWRTEEDAVLVGKGTALADNPQLNVRAWSGRNPVRVLVDRHLTVNNSLNIFDNSQKTLIINELKTDVQRNTTWLQLESFDQYLPQFVAYQLYLLDIRSVIVEGGAEILNLFIAAGLWDEARVFESSVQWSDGIAAPVIGRAPLFSEKIGPDRLLLYHNRGAAAV